MTPVSSIRPRRRPAPHTGEITQRRHRPDYMLVVLSAILLVIGLIVVYAISPGLASQKGVNEGYYVGKQLLAIFLGAMAFVVTSRIPLRVWPKLQWGLVGVAAISSVAVRVVGEQVNGAYRWVQVGGLSFQPVELIKFAVIIWAAAFLANRMQSRMVDNYHQTLKPFLIVAGACTLVVAILQSDLGSMGVIIAILAIMLYLAGLPMKRVLLLGLVVLTGALLLIATSGYRRDRFMTFLNPENDCQGGGYQTCQALIAVGSGGVVGRGLATSGQAFGYLPEAANDSIFAIMAEKFGFLGMSGVMLLFGGLFSRMKRIVEQAPDNYSMLLAAGVLAWLSTQTFINIGAMLGLLPLKGITLPFISYGGTSVLFVTAAIGLVFNISRYTTYASGQEGRGKRHEGLTDWRGNRRPYYAAPRRSS